MRSWIVFVSFVLALGGVAALAEDDMRRVLVDFDGSQAGDLWVTVNDNVMGGRSRGGPSFDGQTMTFSGATNTNGGGFSSVRTRPARWALEDAVGVVIRLKGDGRTYMFDVRVSENWRVPPFRADIPTKKGQWQEVHIPFSVLEPWNIYGPIRGPRAPQLDKERIRGMGFMIYDKKDGPFELEVDWIAALEPDSTS